MLYYTIVQYIYTNMYVCLYICMCVCMNIYIYACHPLLFSRFNNNLVHILQQLEFFFCIIE